MLPTKAITHRQIISALRGAIPADRLLDTLSRAALTGKIPRYGDDGQMVAGAEEEVTPEVRLKMAQYLVDKVMSDAPKEVHVNTPQTEDELKDATLLRTIPMEQLNALAAPALAALNRVISPATGSNPPIGSASTITAHTIGTESTPR